MSTQIESVQTGVEIIVGTEWPVESYVERIGPKCYRLTYDLCNGTARNAEDFKTRYEALDALYRHTDIYDVVVSASDTITKIGRLRDLQEFLYDCNQGARCSLAHQRSNLELAFGTVSQVIETINCAFLRKEFVSATGLRIPV